MPNQRTKQKVQVWMEPALVAQLDGIAARDGKSRAAVVAEACRAYVSADDAEASGAKLDAIAARLDALEARQAASAAAMVEAIKSQPIAVQQLPAPDDEWKDKPLLDRLLKR